MQTNLCVCSEKVSRRCVASVGAAVGRKHIKRHRGLSFVAAVVNLRNIPTEPNHDGWCGCLHAQLCKQTFVYVRGRCHVGARQVWELQLVANASNTIADYHLLHLWSISEISLQNQTTMAGVVVCMLNYANKPLCMFGDGVTEVRGKCGSCSWSQTHQTPSRTIICCSSSESQKYPYRTKPRWLVWLFACSTMQTNLCVCSGKV